MLFLFHDRLFIRFSRSFTGVSYNGEVYLLTGIDPAPLCEKRDNKYIKILLFFLLFKPMKDILEEIMDDLTPDPPDPPAPITTTPPVTPAG